MPREPQAVISPQHLLLLALPDSDVASFLESLTGSKSGPQTDKSSPKDAASLSGTSHVYSIKTQYYRAEVPIWIDIVPAESEELIKWTDEYVSEAAAPVRQALAGIVFLFAAPASPAQREHIEAVLRSISALSTKDDPDGLGVLLAVCPISLPESDDIENLCFDAGMEYIALDGQVVDDDDLYPPKLGMERVKEALEANQWSGGDVEGEEMEDSDTMPEFEIGDGEDAELLNQALLDDKDGDEAGVEGLDGMLERLKSVREESKNLPLDERKRIAAAAVRDAMRQL